MPRITVPADTDPFSHLWSALGPPAIKSAAHQMTEAVYQRSSLSMREFEVARVRIWYVNDCLTCRNFRSARDVPEREGPLQVMKEEDYEHVLDPDWEGYSERERLAIEFAERFALDHTSFRAELWDRLHANFTDDELVDLSICVGWFIASGRVNRVFEIDGAGCQIPPERIWERARQG